MENTVKSMPIWKWALLLLGGFVFFFVLYYCAAYPTLLFDNDWADAFLMLAVSVIFIVVYVLLVKFFEKREISEFAISAMPRHIGSGILWGVAYFTLVTAVLASLGMYKVESVQFQFGPLFRILLMSSTVAVGEEIIFRGVLFRLVGQRWNWAVAYVVSALFFGFAHYWQGTLWSSVAIAIEAGLMLGAAYRYSGNMWMPIGLHWAWNYSEGVIYGFPVSGTESSIVPIISPIVSGPEIITGGNFGPEASIVAVVLGAMLSVWFIVKSKNIQ